MAANGPVMIATDLSERSDRPFERAFLLAEQLGVPLLVLHVVDSRKEPGEEQRAALLERIERAFGATESNSEILLQCGSVTATIPRVAEERRCSVVITGVARFNSPGDYVLGTAVDDIVRRISTPVLVVKERARKPYSRLLVGTDFSSAAMNALVEAAALFPGAAIRLLHVYTSSYDGFLSQDTTTDYIRRQAEESIKAFTDAVPESLRQRLDVRIEQGHLSAVIEKQIADWQADLLVIGSDGGSRIAQATLGSQTADLLGYEPCDTLVVDRRCSRT